MSERQLLPDGFAMLEPFVERWAVAGTDRRAALRGTSTAQEREAFFAEASPLLNAALDHLDTRALDALSDREQRLMNLMLSLAHVSMAVEIQGPDEIRSAPWRERMHITRSAADGSRFSTQSD